MNGKYGRLFTEADVRLLMRFAHIDGFKQGRARVAWEGAKAWSADDALARYESAANPISFPADEPLFLLRGQDVCVAGAIDEYVRLLQCYDTSDEHLTAVDRESFAIRAWQEQHPDRVKVPD